MAQIKLPTIRDTKPGASTEEKIQALTDAYYMLTKHLSFLLSNLDSDNVKELDADITKIKNLVAETIITYTLVTQTLYAEKGYIAELTVDQLDTSQKVKNYLLQFSDKAEERAKSTEPVNYIKVYEQNIEFRTGEVIYGINGKPLTEQAKDRFNKPLYWVDNEHKAVQYENNGNPVMIYKYDELVKAKFTFELNPSSGEYEVKIVLGAGFGSEAYPNRGKAFIEKDPEGLLLRYIKADGTEVFHRLGEDGNIQSHDVLSSLTFYSNGFIAEYGGTQVGYRWTKDSQGRITQLENIYTSEIVPVKWEGGSI